MPVVQFGNHTIEIKFERNGEEAIYYDARIVSSKMSTFGGTHNFSVNEDGKDIAYKVQIKPKGGILGKITGMGMSFAPKVEVFREGNRIYTS